MTKKKKSAVKEIVSERPALDLVTYKVFFHQCLAKGLVKPWQEREIEVFFRELGLKEKEPSYRYSDALAKY